jgi:hypothetical protein
MNRTTILNINRNAEKDIREHSTRDQGRATEIIFHLGEGRVG